MIANDHQLNFKLINGNELLPPFTAAHDLPKPNAESAPPCTRTTCRGESLPARAIIPIRAQQQIEKKKNACGQFSLSSHE
jgi:hypothetical protein